MNSRVPTALALLLTAAVSGCGTIGDWLDRGDNEVRLEGERVPILASNVDVTPDPDLAALTVELQYARGLRFKGAPGEPPVKGIGVFPDPFDVEHGYRSS